MGRETSSTSSLVKTSQDTKTKQKKQHTHTNYIFTIFKPTMYFGFLTHRQTHPHLMMWHPQE